MKIKRIAISNYKNIGQTTLDCSQMIALVSTNNYGKSNLLDGINFGLDFITASAKSRNTRMRWIKGIPLISELAGKDYTFSIEFDEPSLGEYRFVRYGYHFAWYNDQGTGARITDETLEMRPNESVKYTSYIKRTEDKYRASKSTKAFRKLALTDDTLAIDAIGMIDDVEIKGVIKAIQSIQFRLCDSLELDDSFYPNPIEFDFGEDISFGNEDIPKTLAMLQSKKPKLYDLFIETIYDLFPEFNNVELQYLTVNEKTSAKLQAYMVMSSDKDEKEQKTELPYHIRDELYRLVIDSKYLNQPISMEHMSTGTKRIFWLIANAVVSEYKQINLLGIDEVETSIHPKMIEDLLEAIVEILENTTMIITSHSPYLIKYLKPEAIYIGVPNEEGVASFRRIQSRKIKNILNTTRKLETSIGEYLFELMSGDEDSVSILASYLEEE